jgi:hypothetical protein
MVESDIRIVDHEGYISNKGRLEIRIKSEWGSVSAKGMNSNAARLACKVLGYADGVLLNNHKKDSIEVCSEY